MGLGLGLERVGVPLVVVVGECEERAEGVGLGLERAVAAQAVDRRVDHLVRVRVRVGYPNPNQAGRRPPC